MDQAVNLIDLINEENNSLNQVDAKELEEDNVSELQMHKILYLLFGEFCKKFNKTLFKNSNFEAWKLGPVEVDFRYGFQNNKLKEISKFNVFLNDEEISFLKLLIQKFLHFSVWSLVEITHSLDAWIHNYSDVNGGLRNKISEKDIQENF